MLAQAQRRVERHSWRNVELIEADMTQFEPQQRLDGILSTYAMPVVPDRNPMIKRCAQALPDGGRLVILDVKRIGRLPAFLAPLWMLLANPFAGSHKTSYPGPWTEMRRYLTDVQVKESHLGFVYLGSGTKA